MARHFVFTLAAAWVAFIAPALAQQLLVVDIQVTGNQRLPSAAIIAASGLVPGASVTDNELNAAVKRLVDTGLFMSLAWRYDPKTVGEKSGIGVTLQVEEAPPSEAVRLDINGVDEDSLWQEIKQENGLIDTRIPASKEAQDYYLNAIKAALKRLNHDQDVVARNETDLHTGKGTVDYQSASLPKIVKVTFKGNRLINTRTLSDAVAQVSLIGGGYTDHYVRLRLDANIRPMYEERGYLTVKFSLSTMPSPPGVAVLVAVDEGSPWTLGEVTVAGLDSAQAQKLRAAVKFPEGKVANWKQIQMGLQEEENELQREGFVGAALEVTRTYHEENHLVDVAMRPRSTKMYAFGRLEIDGLKPAEEAVARGMWRLTEGDPLDSLYIDDYLRTVSLKIPGIKSYAKRFRQRQGTNIMDVVVKVTMK